MKKTNSSTPAKAAAARENGRKGGTKSPDISRFNSLKHGLNAKKLSILEGKHLPEYGEYAAVQAELVRKLNPQDVLEAMVIETFVVNAWRQRRSFRAEVSATEKPDAGMSSPGTANLLRYLSFANHQFWESYRQIEVLRERKEASALQLALEASSDLDTNRPSQPGAAEEFPPTPPVSVESLSATSTTGHSEEEGKVDQPAKTPLSVTAGPPDEAVHSTPAAEGAQPAQHPAADGDLTSTTEEELNREQEGKVGQMAKPALSATAGSPHEAADSSSSAGKAQPAQGQGREVS